jgi:predicted TIM-barrel fold metal-dependent hydrolase
LRAVATILTDGRVGTAGAARRAAPGMPGIIDTHHHVFPPRYARRNLERLLDDSPLLPPSVYLEWSASDALERMDHAGVATAINSITSPGICFEDSDARAEARDCNEFGAQLARDFPGRFGMFAAIPLPDTEGSLRELEYALDILKLDGVGVLTSYAGKFLGDPVFAPVFDELNRRRAVVFVHPTAPCGVGLIPGLSRATLDFPMDTTRTIASLVLGGTFARCRDVRFIFAHGGGMIPSVAQRIEATLRRLSPGERAATAPEGLVRLLRRQHYDLASVVLSPAAMAGVMKLFPVSRLLYGSDEPFNSTVKMSSALSALGLSPSAQHNVRRGNALRLFPRFGVGTAARS